MGVSIASATLANFYIAFSIIVILADVLVAYHCKLEKREYSYVLAIACGCSGAMQLLYLLSIFFSPLTAVKILSSLYYMSVDFTVLIMLTFIRAYAMRDQSKRNYYMKNTISVIFLVDLIFFAINPFVGNMIRYVVNDGLVAKYLYRRKLLYVFHIGYLYLVIAFIVYHMIKKALSIPAEYRRPYWLSVGSMAIVVGGNAIEFLNPRLFGADAFHYSIWGYSFACFFIYYNCFRYPDSIMKNFYNGWIVDNINQGVVLFNYEGHLLIANDKFRTIFSNITTYKKMPIEEFMPLLGTDIKFGKENEDYSFQYYLEKNDKEYLTRLDHRCLKNSKGVILGQLFVFTNEAGDVDLLTSFYSWEKFKQMLNENPESFKAPMTIAVCDINGLRDINTQFGKSAGDRAIEILSNILRKHFAGAAYYVRGEEASLITLNFNLSEEETRQKLEDVSTELKSINDIGCVLNMQSAVGVVTKQNSDVAQILVETFQGLQNKKLLDGQSRKSELVTSLVKTLSECDLDTEAHVKRTQVMGAELGKRLGLSDMQLSDLALLCILHDIGKIAIPLEILNKPNKLNDAEWRMMKTHTEKGYQIATSSQELNHIADMILHHHERWDGKGYPGGLSKESIPLLSRIISVVDSYDAMVSDRPYRKGMPVEDAIKELKRCAGTQFDPGIVNEFISMLAETTISEEKSTFSIPKDSEEQSQPASAAAEVKNNTVKTNVHGVAYSKYILNNQMRIIKVDAQFEKLTGYTAEDIKNTVITQIDLLPEEDRTEYLRLVSELIGRDGLAYFEHRLVRKDGSIAFVFCYGKVFYDSAEREERSEIIVFDSSNTYAMQIMINEEQSKAAARLAKWEDKYRCDSLTGLLTHEAFKNDIEMKLLEGKSKVMLLMMDVDKFKQYNDSFGHKAGDEFLILLSQSLTATLRKDDLACRMGGDEFAAALFYTDAVSDETMLERASQVCDKMNLLLTTQKGGTSLSMGVVLSGSEIKTFNKLYENADQALYEAKEAGRSRMAVYKKED